MVLNPFILYQYENEHLFCDRVEETRELQTLIENGNNVSLIAPRRIGKSGLIEHLFHRKDIAQKFYTFHIDIYATKNSKEMTLAMGRDIVKSLRPLSRTMIKNFMDVVGSLKSSISFDFSGNPSFDLSIGNTKASDVTLDEIFQYLESADKPCIVAIDEFQSITNYPEKNVEPLLRTYVQRCRNTHFIFSGSQRQMMAEMFLIGNRPFYQSTSMMSLRPIPLEKYISFCQLLFEEYGRRIDAKAVEKVYQEFDGITWYVQRTMNALFALTDKGSTCGEETVDIGIENILQANAFTYQSVLYQLPARQKDLLMAIAKAGKAKQLTSALFINKYNLPSASSVQSALKGLMEKDFVTQNLDVFEVSDRFFQLWLLKY